MNSETADHRLRRLAMRSMRRGIREMDLILGQFAKTDLPDMAEPDLQTYDRLLSENDHDLYQWVTGQSAAPDHYTQLIAAIAVSAAQDR